MDVPGTGINEGDAPETLNTPEDRARLALFAASPQNNYIQLSRFKYEQNQLKIGTEQEIIRVPVDRGLCCHVGGQIRFDNEGNLYLSTGDDTNPFQSSGYTPIDDRANRNPAFDARRSAGNTNDLRGKILRLRLTDGRRLHHPERQPLPARAGEHPPGDLRDGHAEPVPLRGQRHERRRLRRRLLAGRHAPDPARPQGTGRWMLVRNAANFGWPFCAAPDLPYVNYDFDSATSGEEFNCIRPINDSRNNTGLRQLPQVAQPDVWYSYPANDYGVFPELLNHRGGDGIGPMGGPATSRIRRNSSPLRWPNVFRGQPLFYEWTRDYVKVFELNRPNGGPLSAIQHLFGGSTAENPNIVQDNPMDMEFGPNGRSTPSSTATASSREPGGAAFADRLRAGRRVHPGREGRG